jgi:hypothetical protein
MLLEPASGWGCAKLATPHKANGHNKRTQILISNS